MSESEMTHLDQSGRARMVDVAGKDVTLRHAVAEARIRMRVTTRDLIIGGRVPKGDVLAVARIGGIQAAKRTHELIPLCHALALSSVEVTIDPDSDDPAILLVHAKAIARDRTGVEMEALVAASVAALSIYDMCKAVDRGMEVQTIRLLEKVGGKSGTWRREDFDAG